MNARREAAVAFVGALAAALMLLISVSQRWASGTGHTQQVLIVVSKQASGRSTAPLVAAAGLVALAGAAAIPATRRYGRLLAGILLILSGVGAAIESMLRRHTAQSDVRHALPTGASVHASGWPYLALVGAVVLVGVGLLLAVRGPRWASLSARYETPSARGDRTAGDAGTWDALDRGEDPTEPERSTRQR